MNLNELTGHEAGIIVYDHSRVIVANWMSAGEDELVVAAPTGCALTYMFEEGVFDNVEKTNFSNIRELLPDPDDADVLFDHNDDISALYSENYDGALDGCMYRLADGTQIFTLSDWL